MSFKAFILGELRWWFKCVAVVGCTALAAWLVGFGLAKVF